MRKTYIDDFNNYTNFIGIKRNKPNEFFSNSLKKYALNRFFKRNQNKQASNSKVPSIEEFIFFLGSIFYPKRLKELHKCCLKQEEIDMLHGALYKFSATKLNQLFDYKVYQYLLKHFIENYKQNLLSTHPMMASAQQDFTNGFDFLESFSLSQVK